MFVDLHSLEKEENGALPEHQYPIRFAVRSLGWVPIAEEDLSQEKSSRAVNKCIVDLSSGKRDINDVVGRWGDVSTLYTFVCKLVFVCMYVDMLELETPLLVSSSSLRQIVLGLSM